VRQVGRCAEPGAHSF